MFEAEAFVKFIIQNSHFTLFQQGSGDPPGILNQYLLIVFDHLSLVPVQSKINIFFFQQHLPTHLTLHLHQKKSLVKSTNVTSYILPCIQFNILHACIPTLSYLGIFCVRMVAGGKGHEQLHFQILSSCKSTLAYVH